MSALKERTTTEQVVYAKCLARRLAKSPGLTSGETDELIRNAMHIAQPKELKELAIEFGLVTKVRFGTSIRWFASQKSEPTRDELNQQIQQLTDRVIYLEAEIYG